MGETQIKKIATVHRLHLNGHEIEAIIEHTTNRITLKPCTLGKTDFVFINSKPEILYTIGTLIRDAADLIRQEE